MTSHKLLQITTVIFLFGLLQTNAVAKPENITTKKLISYVEASEVDEQNILLQNAVDEITAIIPVSSRANVSFIKIHIEFVNSVSLSKDRAQLRFRFNGKVIGQAPLDPNYPSGSINLTVPPSDIVEGNNILKLESNLHSAQAYAPLYSSELWTEINAVKSYVKMTYTDKAIDEKLSSLPNLIYGSEYEGVYPLTMLSVGDFPTDTLMDAQSLVSQTIAKYIKNIPLKIHASLLQTQGVGVQSFIVPHADQDIVVVGTYAQLADVLGGDFLQNTEGQKEFVGLYQSPANAGRFLLLVAGETESDVLSIADYLVHLNISQVDKQILTRTDNEDAMSYTPVSDLKENMRYTFSQLDMPTKELTGIKDYAELKLKLPNDFFALVDDDVEVLLHFSHAAFLGQGSSISVLLNDEFHHSIPLGNESGLHVHSWRLSFPLRSFRKGMNTIRFQGYIAPSNAAKEHQHMIDAIKVTLFDDSIVRIPSISSFTKLPDLNLIKSTGYPYTQAEESAVILAEKDFSYLSSGLMFVSKLSQLQGQPQKSIHMSTQQIKFESQNMILISDLESLPKAVLDAFPIKKEKSELWMPMFAANALIGVAQNTITSMLGFDQLIQTMERDSVASVMQQVDLDRLALMSQAESPYEDSKTLTLITAKSPGALKFYVETLVKNDEWSMLEKDNVIWGNDYHPQSFKNANEYHAGDLTFFAKVSYYAITSPLFLFLLVFTLVVIVTWLTRLLLQRHAAFHRDH